MNPSLEHIDVFIAVVESGSFSAAARRLNRAQSAVTYAVQKLEEEMGVALFDRSGQRPILTEIGRSLLPYARRAADEVSALRLRAAALAEGVESEVSIVADTMFPEPTIVEALRTFADSFPHTTLRISEDTLGAAAQLVLNDQCQFGLLGPVVRNLRDLEYRPLLSIELVPVVAPHHPLAAATTEIPNDVINKHLQLVLADKAGFMAGQNFNILSTHVWMLTDLSVKRRLIEAGIGWGSLPLHAIAQQLNDGTLVRFRPAEWGGPNGSTALPMYIAHRRNARLGPAATWLINYIAEQTASGV